MVSAFFALLWGCSPTPPHLSALSHAELRLPLILGNQNGSFEGTTVFNLPQAVTGARLRVEGWWQVDLKLDEQALTPVYPGLAPDHLSLPPLSAGIHHLAVRVSSASTESPRLSLANRMFHTTPAELWLELQPSAHITQFAIDLHAQQLTPSLTANAPSDSTVEIVLSDNGTVLQHWSPQSLEHAWPTQSWRGPTWSIAAPQLITATAILRSTDGTVLDIASKRVGLRTTELASERFLLNGQPSPLLAMRVNPHENITDILNAVAEVGANAVEIHGVVAPDSWLSRFDEWGLAVVFLPRCDGGFSRDPQDLLRLAPQMAAQDQRLMQLATQHPAILTWICEGASGQQEALCGRYHQDPLHRPVMGLDNLGTSMMGLETAGPPKPAWVIEIGAGANFRGFETIARAFLTMTGAQGPGGVILPPPPVKNASWAPAWKSVTSTLQATPWQLSTHRAMSTVVVSGLKMGDLAVLSAPWLSPVGAFADGHGEARIQAWYEGAATLLIGEKQISVALVADQWQGLSRIDHHVTLAAP